MSFTRYEFSIRPSVQYNSIPWLRADRTDNRLQIKQQHGIGSYIFYALVTFTQEAHGKAEGHICPGVLDLQVAKAMTGSVAIHSSNFVICRFSLMFTGSENICDVEINSCRINHKDICREWFLSKWFCL